MKVAGSLIAILTIVFTASMVRAQENDQGPEARGEYKGTPVAPAAGLTPAPKVERVQKWVHLFANFANPKTTEQVLAITKQAKAAGYTAMLIGDTKFGKLQLTDEKYKKAFHDYRKACKDLGIQLIVAVGAEWGYSETFLSHDPNLAEGMPTRNDPFIVKDGKLVPFDDGTTKLVNGSFEELQGGKPAGWETNDLGKNLSVDKDIKCDGATSIRIEVSEDKKGAHLSQKIKVKPWQYYIISAKVRNEGFSGREVRLWATTEKNGGNYMLNDSEIDVALSKNATSEWKTIGSRFCSQDATEVTVQVGVWAGKKGKLWFDDVKVQPGGFVNILRRESTPLTVTSEDGKTTYVEGKDFAKVADPKLGNDPTPGYWTSAHDQPVVPIPADSALKEGQKVLASYCFALESGKPMQMSVSLAEPGVWPYVEQQVQWMKDNVQPDMYFMGFDEMRVGGWDDSCVKSGKTQGKLLAETAAKMIATLKKIDPGKPISVWNDMFDPNHNASPTFKQYYMLKSPGPWAGSWEGLSSDVIVVNWLGKKPESAAYFAERGNQQILSDGSADRIVARLDAAKKRGLQGVVGVMYTNWSGDFSKLKEYADAVDAWFAKNKGN